ncbi:Ribosome maturation factor RimM [Thalassocella blandensis]|nr:Ribosome maturation factor RimM [Thalassocella blandensis]
MAVSVVSEKRLDLVAVGRAASVFGVKGWVKVQSFTEPHENILDYAPWWLKTRHGVKSFEVDEVKVRAQDILVHFKGLDDRDIARQFLPAEIAVDKSQFEDLGEGDFYWHQLVGLKVFSNFDGQQYALGVVTKLLETGANDVLVVDGKVESEPAVAQNRQQENLQEPQGSNQSTEQHSESPLPAFKRVEARERLIPYVPDMYVTQIDLAQGEIWVNWDPEF